MAEENQNYAMVGVQMAKYRHKQKTEPILPINCISVNILES